MECYCSKARSLGLWRTIFCRALAVVVGVFIVIQPLSAKATPAMSLRGKLIKPGQLTIAGLVVKCGNIPALINDHYPDFGAARRGLIILNSVRLRPLTRGAKLLIYYHECAHQHVGGNELAADCWAVQKIRRDGLMDRAGLQRACRFVETLPANLRHPSGKMRCRQMIRCYNHGIVRKAMKRPIGRELFLRRGFAGPRQRR